MQNLKLLGTAAFVAAFSLSAFGEKVVSSNITTNETWTQADSPVILEDTIYVTDGAVLTIEPGVIVRGQPESAATNVNAGSVVVTRGSKIIASGTAQEPIIFTTAAVDQDNDGEYDVDSQSLLPVRWDSSMGLDVFHDADPLNNPLPPYAGWENGVSNDPNFNNTSVQYNRGLWAGIVLLGLAPTNAGTTVNNMADGFGDPTFLDDYHEGAVEGINSNPLSVYGGSNPNDSSGVIRYVSIRHGGTEIGEGNEINGLTMGGVGYGTQIEYVEVYLNNDDGYEWFGGTVNTRNLVSLFNHDDSFDIDEGFTGLGQFWFSLQLDDRQTGNHSGEHDGTDAEFNSVFVASVNGVPLGVASTDDDAKGGLPLAYPTIYNATYIGGGAGHNDSYDSGRNDAFRIRDSWGGAYRNSIFSDFGGSGIRVDSDGVDRWKSGDISFKSNYWYNFADGGTAFVSNPASGDAFSSGDDIAMEVMNGASGEYAANRANNFTNNHFDVDPFGSRRIAIGDIPAMFNRRSGLDPRPVNLDGTLSSATSTFFSSASYFGAFNPSESLWTDGWTAGSALGVLRMQQ
ncbi:MAG: hypothetical protein E1N59_2603 [Puniceicoccaceae bacterium 5H]|nr:MAG: hypothetical protein E1N59_2603 [Puniceicoccaceae bacterium 5H]